jgi:hypothetical protein
MLARVALHRVVHVHVDHSVRVGRHSAAIVSNATKRPFMEIAGRLLECVAHSRRRHVDARRAVAIAQNTSLSCSCRCDERRQGDVNAT